MTAIEDTDLTGASCREYPGEMFFEPLEVRPAKTICRGCPARSVCLTEAMVNEQGMSRNYRFGIFGGLTPRDRSELDDAGWTPGDPAPPVKFRKHGNSKKD